MTENKKAEKHFIEDDFNSSLNIANKIYKDGGVFAYPTDTIYGLGCDPFNKKAIHRIMEIKGREESNKFILLVNDIQSLEKWAKINSDRQMDFLYNIWPAPISVVMELNAKSAKWLNQATAAFRIPKNKFCNALLARLNSPLISTSVNKTGHSPLNDEKMIEFEFGDEIDAIFISKKNPVGSASTLIELISGTPKLLREGSVKFEKIMERYYS